jgi:hypothetical protein
LRKGNYSREGRAIEKKKKREMTKTFSLFEWSAGLDYLGRLSLQQ